jgi:site-specific DNA recombinase
MDVLIYSRVSTHAQDNTRQIEELQNFCKAFNYNIIETFSEIVSGAKERKQRKQISKLLEYVETNTNIKGILVWELSRLGRNTADVLSIINELNEKKIWVYAKKENLYTLNFDGSLNLTSQLTISILSGVASHERETTIQRSISGLRSNTKSGNWTGGVFLPYGYKRVNKKLEIDEEEAKVVKQIFQLSLEGKGTKVIANILNEKKIPTRYNLSLKKDEITINGRKVKKEEFSWKDGTIYSILTNEVYKGKKKGKGHLEGIELKSPPIIDEEVFDSVLNGLKNKQVKRTTKFFYLFQNKLNCGRCKRTYFPHKRTPKDPNKVSSDNRYICLSKRYNEKCDNYGIGISKMNDGVWSVLRNNKEEIENILQLNSTDLKNIDEQIRNIQNEIEVVEKRIKQLENQEKKLVDLYISESIDKNIYTNKFQEITKEKAKDISLLDDLEIEKQSKIQFKKKQSNVNLQIRNIKENKRTLKKTIDGVVNNIIVYPIFKHNLNEYFKINKQDRFVFIEIYTYLNESVPLIFVVSQRSNFIITPKHNEFKKEDCVLNIGGFEELEDGFEEEAAELSIRNLFHLSILD